MFEPWSRYATALFILFVYLLYLYKSGVLLRKRYQLQRSGLRTTGYVVALPLFDAEESLYNPRIEYVVAGQSYSLVAILRYTPSDKIPRVFPILYDPANPGRAEVDSWWTLYGAKLLEVAGFSFAATILLLQLFAPSLLPSLGPNDPAY